MQIDMIKPTRGAAFWEIAAGPGSHVYALGGTKFVVSSSDAGASWTEEQLLTSKRTLKRVGLTAEGNLLVGTEGGQLFERVAGVWSETALKGLGEIASIVRTDEATVVGGKLLLRRPHGATEWLPVATKPKKLLRAQVIAAGGSLLGLFAQDILKSALWRSDDHGATWTALDVELEPQAEQVAAEGSRIVVSFVGGRALHSKDGGRSWQRVTLVNEAPYVRPLVAVVGDAIFTALQGTGSTGLFRSDDDGGTWTLVTEVSAPARLATGPDGSLYAASWNGAGLRLRDSTSSAA